MLLRWVPKPLFSLSFSSGEIEELSSCTGLEGISLDTQFMQSEAPHHLGFAGPNRRENVLFQDTFWGDFCKTQLLRKWKYSKTQPLWLTGVPVWIPSEVHSAEKAPGGGDVFSCLMRAGLPQERGIVTGNGCGWSSQRSFHEPFYTDRLRLGMFR